MVWELDGPRPILYNLLIDSMLFLLFSSAVPNGGRFCRFVYHTIFFAQRKVKSFNGQILPLPPADSKKSAPDSHKAMPKRIFYVHYFHLYSHRSSAAAAPAGFRPPAAARCRS